MAESLSFPDNEAAKLERWLPQSSATSSRPAPPPSARPFVTLTFATSLDSALSLAPGTRTILSGPESKAMTHFLRSRHDAICVGVGTAIADDPGLNCRLGLGTSSHNHHHPRPVVVDPSCRWELSRESKVMQLASAGLGLAPWVVTVGREPPAERKALLEEYGGKFIVLGSDCNEQAEKIPFQWADMLSTLLLREKIKSIMIEGGGHVINSLLEPRNNSLVDSVIVTVAPTWLGKGGVVVSPDRVVDEDGEPKPAVRLTNVAWIPLGEDVVLCGRIKR